MPSSVIEVEGAVKRFGPVVALAGVDLAVERGEIFGLIGHNGAGKSTLFKLMLGLLGADAGRIAIEGVDVRGDRFRDVRRRIGFMPESVTLYGNLTGAETLAFFARLKGENADAEASCRRLLERVGLAAAAQRPVRHYSKGMVQRLLFAQALAGEPGLLFLDEPTHGLDPAGVRELYEILAALRARGVTVILSSHILADVAQRVDRLALLSNGRMRAVGTVAALREALDLPLAFDVRLASAAAGDFLAALERIGIAGLRVHEGRVSFHCPRARKLAVLAASVALGEALLDIDVEEPSLEDVFMTYQERDAAA